MFDWKDLIKEMKDKVPSHDARRNAYEVFIQAMIDYEDVEYSEVEEYEDSDLALKEALEALYE